MRYLLLLGLLFVSGTAYCQPTAQNPVNEVHENSDGSTIVNLVEDVLSLLPPEFAGKLDRKELLESSKLNVDASRYWKKELVSKNDLNDIYEELAERYRKNRISDRELSQELGNNIRNLIEVAMSSSGSDVLGEQLRKNMEAFLRETHKETCTVSYKGYAGENIKEGIDKLYELRKLRKKGIYPSVVAATATLWTALYSKKAKSFDVVAKSFVRQPLNIPLVGSRGRSSGYASSFIRQSPAASDDSFDPRGMIIILTK